MASTWKIALAAAGLSGLAACTNAVVTQHPNPPPPPGDRILCGTAMLPLAQAHTHCTPVIAPAAETVVVRARG